MANIENKDPKKDFNKRMVKALFSYTPVNIDELQLKVNDILEVIEETEEGWWKGILDGNIGMFPSNFVIELDSFPEELNNKLMNELSPSKNISKVKSVPQQEPLHRHGNNIVQNKQDSKQGMLNSTNSDGIDGSSSSKGSSDFQPEKRLITMKKSSGDMSAPRLPPKPVREQARVLFPYESQNEDELTLKEGEIITVLSKEIEDKGWWRGELNNKIGVFPDNFVKLIKAEEQKKPERPDKPATVIASKNSLKSIGSEKSTESSPKVDKKVVKIPPAKPPPPEISKKEPDRPLPPCPSKKPQPLQPVKKPMRSSLGPKVPAMQAPTVTSVKSPVSDTSPSIATTFPSSEKNGETTKSDVVLRRESKNKVDFEFDAVESCGKKLVHLTANRAKAPSKRPPSFIFMKENEREHSVIDSRRLSEPSLCDIETLLPLSDTKKSNAVSTSNVEMRPKVPPLRPSLPIMKSNSIGKHDTIVVNKTSSVSDESNIKPQEVRKKDVLSDKVPTLMKEVLQPKVSESSSNVATNRPSSVVIKVPSKAPPDITKAPDVTKVTSDISKAPPDVTRAPPDVTRAPPDVTKAPLDVTKAPLDVTKAPPDVMKTPDVTKVPPDVATKASSNIAPKVPPDVASKTIFTTSTKVAFNAVTKSSNLPSNVQSIEVIPSVPPKVPPNPITKATTVPTDISSKSNASLEAEVHGIGDDLKMVMVNMVSKNEYNALLKQVDELKGIVEVFSTKYSKAVSDLKEELEYERQLRRIVEVELQKLKDGQKT